MTVPSRFRQSVRSAHLWEDPKPHPPTPLPGACAELASGEAPLEVCTARKKSGATSSGGSGPLHLGMQVQGAARPALLSAPSCNLQTRSLSWGRVLPIQRVPHSEAPAAVALGVGGSGGEDQTGGAGMGWNSRLSAGSGPQPGRRIHAVGTAGAPQGRLRVCIRGIREGEAKGVFLTIPSVGQPKSWELSLAAPAPST